MLNTELYYKIETISIFIFLFALPLSISISQLGFFLALIMWIAINFKNKSFNNNNNELNIPILFYVFINFISIIIIAHTKNSIIEFGSLGLILIFYIINSINEKKNIIYFLYTLMFVGVIVSIFGIYQHSQDNQLRVESTLGSCMTLGHFLSMLIILEIGLIAYEKEKIKRIVIALSLIIMGFGITYSYTRGAWLGLFAGIMVFSILKKNYTILVALFIFLIFFIYTDNFFLDRIRGGTLSLDYSSKQRLYIWETSIKTAMEHPIFGIGLKNFRNFFLKTPPPAWEGIPYENAHNIFIQHMIELGIPGVLSFMWIIALYLKNAYSILKKNNNKYKPIIISSLSAFIAFTVSGIFDYNYGDKKIFMFLWFIMGITFLLSKDESDFKS
ncbi:O-antigen ligase family protein [Candidatus Poribacteria bacterium]|nr:O-antigen ligase family protein [Candidatus Poribacteria bacterium]